MLFSFISNEGFTQAEQDTTLYSIETIDGNEFLGSIVTENDTIIILNTQNFGNVTIQKSNIKKISKIGKGKIIEGEYWFENPQSTRYFWSPNAYGLRPGEGYYQNVWVFFNQVAVGITDNISIGAGTVPLFFFGGAPTPVWLTPRVSFPIVKDKFNIGGGALIGTIIGEKNSGFGIVYGNTTFGSRDKNFNIGLGWGYSEEGGELGGGFAKSPTLTVSSMIRLGKKWYFLTENYYIDAGGEPVILLSGGARVIIKKVSLDFGLVAPFVGNQDFFVAVPWLGFVVPFGK